MCRVPRAASQVNAVLKHLSPLIVSVILLLETLVGPLLGCILITQRVPGAATWVGGTVMVLATVLVTVEGARTHEPQEATDAAASQQLSPAGPRACDSGGLPGHVPLEEEGEDGEPAAPMRT